MANTCRDSTAVWSAGVYRRMVSMQHGSSFILLSTLSKKTFLLLSSLARKGTIPLQPRFSAEDSSQSGSGFGQSLIAPIEHVHKIVNHPVVAGNCSPVRPDQHL